MQHRLGSLWANENAGVVNKEGPSWRELRLKDKAKGS